MNISNIFGLHLGCRVKVYNTTGTILSVNADGSSEVYFACDFLSSMANIKDCKLLLKPVFSITEDDKKEFQEKYIHTGEFISHFSITICDNKKYAVYARTIGGWSNTTEYDFSINQLLWLASKSYDIGLVPDEYKIVEE